MGYEIVRMKSINSAIDAFANNLQFTFVKLDTNGLLNTPSNGGEVIGVLQDKPKIGDPGAVCGPGDITKVMAGGTITAGQYVQTDGTGKAVACVSGSRILGQALGAGASGSIVEIVFQPGSPKL